MKDFNYVRPTSLEQALAFLAQTSGKCLTLAGGTDLIPQIRDGKKAPDWVMDVKAIPELQRLEVDAQGSLHLGAVVPCADVAGAPQVQQRFPLLAQVCSLIGGSQIQNRASVGGNLCNAAPSADTAPALLCLGARARLARPGGWRDVPLEDFFVGPGQTVLTPQEVLVEIVVPPPPAHSAGSYLRMTPREEMDIAIAGVASFLVLSPQDRRCQEARLALGAVAPTPRRARQAEAVLTGHPLSQERVEQASQKAASEAQPISDVRASADYRRHLVRVLAQRTMEQCLDFLGVKLAGG